MVMDKQFEEVKDLILELKDFVNRQGFNLTSPFRTYEERQNFINKIKDIVTDNRKFNIFMGLLHSSDILDNEERENIRIMTEAIMPQELTSIIALDLPYALMSSVERGLAHVFMSFSDTATGKSFSSSKMLNGFMQTVISYLHAKYVKNDSKKAQDVLRLWADNVLSKVEESLGVEVNREQYVKDLGDALDEFFNRHPEKDKLVNTLKNFLYDPIFDEIKNLSIFQFKTEKVNPSGKKETVETLPSFLVTILDDVLSNAKDPSIVGEIVGKITDQKSPFAILLVNNNIDNIVTETFKKIFLDNTFLFGRMGLIHHIIASPDVTTNPQYNFNDVGKVNEMLNGELSNIFFIDLALRDLLKDKNAKSIIQSLRNSQGLERSMEFDDAFNTLKEHLSFMIQRRYKDAFYKNHRPVFDVYPLDRGLRKDLKEKIQNLKERIIKDFISYFWKKVDEYMLKDIIEERLPKNETGSYILDILREHYYKDRDEYLEKFPELGEALKKLKTFDLNIGREYGYNDGSRPYDIEKDTGKFKGKYAKEKGLKDESVFDDPLLNEVLKPNEEIIENNRKAEIDNTIREVGKQIKESDKLHNDLLKDTKGLNDVFENAKKIIERISGGRRKEDEIKKVFSEWYETEGKKNSKEVIIDLHKKVSENLSDKDKAYNTLQKFNRYRFCKMSKGELKISSENKRFIMMYSDVIHALKRYIKNEEDFKRIASLYTLASFGISPVSQYMLTKLGISQEAKFISLDEAKSVFRDRLAKVGELINPDEKTLNKVANIILEFLQNYRKAVEGQGIERDIKDVIYDLVEEGIYNSLKNITKEKDGIEENKFVDDNIRFLANLLHIFQNDEISEKLDNLVFEKLSNVEDNTEHMNNYMAMKDMIKEAKGKYENLIRNDEELKNKVNEYLCNGKNEGGENFIGNIMGGLGGAMAKALNGIENNIDYYENVFKLINTAFA